jgi:hypothetical protein
MLDLKPKGPYLRRLGRAQGERRAPQINHGQAAGPSFGRIASGARGRIRYRKVEMGAFKKHTQKIRRRADKLCTRCDAALG